jgi:hypothetical protein
MCVRRGEAISQEDFDYDEKKKRKKKDDDSDDSDSDEEEQDKKKQKKRDPPLTHHEKLDEITLLEGAQHEAAERMNIPAPC